MIETITIKKDQLNAMIDDAAKQIADLQVKNEALIKTAKAVIDRWDSPNWRDGTHTAEYIHSLRDAVKACLN